MAVNSSGNIEHDYDDTRRPERNYDSTVDAKIAELNSRVSRYYSSLTSKQNESVREFQEFIFLSLLEEREESGLFENIKKTDLETEEVALVEAFQRLGVKPSRFESKAKSYFARLKKAKDNSDSAIPNISITSDCGTSTNSANYKKMVAGEKQTRQNIWGLQLIY